MSVEPERPTYDDDPVQPAAPSPQVKPRFNRATFVVVAVVGLFVIGFAVRVIGVFHTNAVTASYDFQTGQCFERAPVESAGTSTPVDCAEPHYGEVFAVETVPGDTYPGETAVKEFAHSKCPVDGNNALTVGRDYPDVAIAELYPQDNSWAHGDRTVKCFFHRRDDQPTTGHAKDGGVPYTADQKRYLGVSQPYDAILREQAAAALWPDQHAVAVRSVPVLQKEIDVLIAGPWPADAKAAVAALVAAKQVELADRQKAAAAADRGTLTNALYDADRHSGADETDAVRVALHLQPAH